MRTIKIYEKKDWNNFFKNTPEYSSSYSSHFLERYNIKTKPENIDIPENQLFLTYLVEGLKEKDLLDLKDKYKSYLEKNKEEQEKIKNDLKEKQKMFDFINDNFNKIKSCTSFQEAFNILIK